MLSLESQKMLPSLKLKMPMKSWLLNGILINTKNIGNQLKQSFIRLLKPLKFSLIGTKDLTMINYSVMNTALKMLIRPLRDSLMNMVFQIIKKRSSLTSIFPIPSTPTMLILVFQEMLLLMT
jgi:hypothetical protein